MSTKYMIEVIKTDNFEKKKKTKEDGLEYWVATHQLRNGDLNH